jgi:hypothetical protein
MSFYVSFSVPTHCQCGRSVVHGNARQQHRRRVQRRILPGRRPLLWYVTACSGPLRIVALAQLGGFSDLFAGSYITPAQSNDLKNMLRAQLVQHRPMPPTPHALTPLMPSLRRATRASIWAMVNVKVCTSLSIQPGWGGWCWRT